MNQKGEVVTGVFPRSVLSTNRAEFGATNETQEAKKQALKLLVKDDKKIPEDLQGHVFIIGPVGSVNSPNKPGTEIVFPASDGSTALYNGDGMVYRLDFNDIPAGVKFSSALMKTPCYYADIATFRQKKIKFYNLGILRFSEKLGARNQLNTAFLPMKFSEEEGYRLLATWDIGRPYEIDTETLELITPVGNSSEWRPMNPLMADLPFQPPFPFPLIQGSAHPCFDFNTKEMFTVNTGRSLTTFLSQLRPVIYWVLDVLSLIRPHPPEDIIIQQPREAQEEKQAPSQNIFEKIIDFFKSLILAIYNLLQAFNPFSNFTYLVRWDGKGNIQKWKLVQANGCPVKIEQSLHQFAITEDYIILIDTAFKMLIEEILPAAPGKKYKSVEKWLRNLIDRQQLADNRVYIVRREALKPDKKKVRVQKASIPRGTNHFIAEYKNPNQQITLHMANMGTWDAAEWIRDIDESVFKSGEIDDLEKLYGVIMGPTDISRLGCHILNGETGKLIRSDLTDLYENYNSNKSEENKEEKPYSQYTWGPALFTCVDTPPPQELQDIYWSCLGCWPELLTKHGLKLYKDFKYRDVPEHEVINLTKEGIQSNLLRLHIKPLTIVSGSENRLEIQDIYQFPSNSFGTSPQFVPRAGGSGNSTDGYIVCVVHHGTDEETDNGNEIWIFDAANLKQGPVCQLWHPELKLGFTVHTAWLPKISKRTATYNIPVEDDYKDLVAKQPPEIQELFEKEIYPHFQS
ncbi:carotenoid oxygenase family protein [Ancylothrix sp. C2]|uniref:carotenoid oxygenase family protein n=1 Tax=Ancylothrix sp. D3o TaxID=2953691 RepID=UPI0021BA6F63|nr:carotenoid oxygenase family protein [Ancylothrix sp. D3o]MCT7949595.1 carotenoid oxygenase family protein [Ancylothrix sp. D3o]